MDASTRTTAAERKTQDVLEYAEANGNGFIPWFPIATGKPARPGGQLEALAKE